VLNRYVARLETTVATCHATTSIGVGAGKFLECKGFSPYFPKLVRKVFVQLLLTIFSHKDHENLFLDDLQEKGLHVLFCKQAPFLPGFSDILPRFLGCFARIFDKSKHLEVSHAPCTPAPTPLTTRSKDH